MSDIKPHLAHHCSLSSESCHLSNQLKQHSGNPWSWNGKMHLSSNPTKKANLVGQRNTSCLPAATIVAEHMLHQFYFTVRRGHYLQADIPISYLDHSRQSCHKHKQHAKLKQTCMGTDRIKHIC